jgi:hypothetical protein
MSARSVLSVLDADKYEVTQVGITRDGRLQAQCARSVGKREIDGLEQVIFSPDPHKRHLYVLRNTQYVNSQTSTFFPSCTDLFEDGTLQGR